MAIFLATTAFLLSMWLAQTIENNHLRLAIRVTQIVVLAALPPSLITLWIGFAVIVTILLERWQRRTSRKLLLKEALLRYPFATLALIAGVGPQGCMLSKVTQIKEQAAFFPPLAQALQSNPIGVLEELIHETVQATGWSQLYEVFNLRGDSDIAALSSLLTQILSSTMRPTMLMMAAVMAVLLVLLVVLPLAINSIYGFSRVIGF